MPAWHADSSRQIVERIIIEADLELVSVTSFAGLSDDGTDIPLLVEGGEAILLGTSLAGALRTYLREREHGYGEEETVDGWAATLFGAKKGDDKGLQSALICNDAYASQASSSYRDGVAIEGGSGTAADKALFNISVWDIGTSFSLRFELVITKEQNGSFIKKLLASCLTALQQGDIRLGGRKNRGYGEVRVKGWQVKEYKVASQLIDLLAFLEEGGETLSEPLQTNLFTCLGVENDLADSRAYLAIDGCFALEHSLLMHSADSPQQMDKTHIHSRVLGADAVPIFTGTGSGGALRQRLDAILSTFRYSPNLPGSSALFGSTDVHESRLRIDETFIQNASVDVVQQRIKIDRFSGGVIQQALFDALPVFAQQDTLIYLRVHLKFYKTSAYVHETALLLLLLKDVWLADLPFGGEKQIGRGRLRGVRAHLSLNHSSEGRDLRWWHLEAEEHGKLKVTSSHEDVDPREQLETFVEALGQAA